MDPFRAKYRELTAEEKEAVAAVKLTASSMLQKIEAAISIWEGDIAARDLCMTMARTKLEECVFWAVKGITA